MQDQGPEHGLGWILPLLTSPYKGEEKDWHVLPFPSFVRRG